MPQLNDTTPVRPPEITDPELLVLEALRIAHASTGAAQYRSVYEQLCRRVAARHVPEQDSTPRQQPIGSAPAAQPPPAEAGIGSEPHAPGPTRMRVICATRKGREEFFSETPLGRSLNLLRPPGVELRLFPRNHESLPAVYNRAIEESINDDVIFVFIHDDVYLCDFHWASRLASGLGAFDVIGLAGNRRRVARQPGWLFLDERLTRDSRANVSGVVAHGRQFPPESIDVFGPAGQAVKLLDGVFLAMTSATLRAKSLRFDERYEFHFYDMDFCRQAEQAGLTMGTWPISVVHESEGNFVSDDWRRGYDRYLEKWKE